MKNSKIVTYFTIILIRFFIKLLFRFQIKQNNAIYVGNILDTYLSEHYYGLLDERNKRTKEKGMKRSEAANSHK